MPRDGICNAICSSFAGRLVILRAPAGFGKTTTMAQCRSRFEQAGLATAWLTLDLADNDPARFLTKLHTTVDQLLPSQDQELYPNNGTAALGERALAAVDRLVNADRPFVLFIDEFEALREGAAVAIVRELLDRLPPGARLVIGTRTLPDLRLARHRARGTLLEIDAQHLRFTPDETSYYFAACMGLALEPQELATLHRKTEGWVAALWLAGLALRRLEERSAFIARFSGADAGLPVYLAEEVLAQQSPSMRRFLLRTSILRELSVPLCEALIPTLDSSAMLQQLESANAFLIPVEDRAEAWRYHSLFGSFLRVQLRRELPREAVAELHRAAARWYLHAGRPVPAIDHLIEAGDFVSAVATLSPEATELLTQGRMRLLTRWFDAIPASLLEGWPLLQVAKVWATCYMRGPREATQLTQSLSIENSPNAEVRAHVAAVRSSMLALQDRWAESYSVARDALALLPSPSPFANASLANTAASAATALGRYTEARDLLEAARQSQGQHASAFHRMYSESIEGMIDLLEGRLRQATARFRLAVRATQSGDFGPSHGNAWAGLPLAISIYEVNDLDQAARLLQVYLPLAEDVWLPDHIILGRWMLSRIAFNKGDIDQAFQTLSELEYLGHQRQIPRLTASAHLERARLLLMQGHIDAAATELQRSENPELWRSVDACRHLAHDLEDHTIGRLRWQLHAARQPNRDAVDPFDLAEKLLSLARSAERDARHRRLLKVRLLQAMAVELCGDPEAAYELALQAARIACAEGAMRILLDEGPWAGALIRDAYRALDAARLDPIFSDYLQRLSTAFGPETVEDAEPLASEIHLPAGFDTLTRKEIRMLQLLAEGYSNSALGEKLFVSDSTVRTHLRNINSKLGASNRTQAVAIGRKMGLIR